MKLLKIFSSMAVFGVLLSGCTSSTDFGYGFTGNVMPRFAFWDGVLLEPEDQAFAAICQHMRAFEKGKLIVDGQIKTPSKAELNNNFRDISIAGLELLSIKFPEMNSYKEGAVAKLADPGKNSDGWNQLNTACDPYIKLIDRTFFVTKGTWTPRYPSCLPSEYQFGVQGDLRVQKGDEWISIADGEFIEDEFCKNDVYSEDSPLRLEATIPKYSEKQTLRWYLTITDGGEFSDGGNERFYEFSVGDTQ